MRSSFDRRCCSGLRRLVALVLAACAVACRSDEAPPAPPPVVEDLERVQDRELALLLSFENERRAATDFATLPPSNAALGPDPYRIARLDGGTRVAVLRGESAIVALAPDGTELARALAPASPSGLAVAPDGSVLVVGEGSRDLVRYRFANGRLERTGVRRVPALGMRDLAVSRDGKTAYIVEDYQGRLLAVALDAPEPSDGVRELGRCHGPLRVDAGDGYVATSCVLDHTIEIRRGASLDGEPVRIRHDGPLWSFAIRSDGGDLTIAAGGVEDHPLLREDGGFGYIDSFIYVYALARGQTQAVRLAAVNASELGAVTPKWLAFGRDQRSLTVAPFGSAGLYTLTWRDRAFTGTPEVARGELPPGTTSAVIDDDGALLAANPLLDAWVVARRGAAARVVAVRTDRPARALPSRLGELLFFTTAMAPWNGTAGKLSRFTCETCHHEGYVDGRTHFTGRTVGDESAKVHATSRPLLGLFNNRPHFSRALDKTMTQMVHAEFRVANRHNGRDPWFALTHAEAPWLADAGIPSRNEPAALRRAFMSFLMDFTHRSNPAATERGEMTALERTGAAAFRDRCAGCHAPRLVADDAKSAVPFARWESLVMSPAGPIVWSNADYFKTGVVPYVHDTDGARVPALRRLYKKWPYFTNGSARSLPEILDNFAWDVLRTYHAGAPEGAVHLGAEEKSALLAFLALL